VATVEISFLQLVDAGFQDSPSASVGYREGEHYNSVIYEMDIHPFHQFRSRMN
jgi:hypothetical protein